MSLKARLAQFTLTSALLALSTAAAHAMQVDIMVDKVSQHMRVMVDGRQQYDWLVSTGGQGFDTPSGSFHIFRMEKDHFSKEWDDAPMPYSMFFTGIGHAIHGSFHVKALGTRASHGCVRLAPENAAVLWDLITKAGFKNNSVTIKGGMFDNGNLTTEQTFHMTPKDHADMIAAQGQPKGLFWWTKQPSQPDAKPAAQTGGLAALFGARPKADLKAKAAADAKLADAAKKKKKKKKKLLDESAPAATQG